MAAAALETRELSKRFGRLQAVDGVSISVAEGSVYGFLGPNGAGKTTTIRMILGLVAPTSGTALAFGRDLRREFKRAIRQVGAMVEGPAFYPFLSARKNLELFARLSGGLPPGRIDATLETVGLRRRADERLAGYSQGMRQRLGIALALLHAPRLLILDEPTNGLDPQGTREVRRLLRRIRDAGETTVFLSSHLLAEMEQLCDRVAVLARGRVLAEDSLDGLLAGSSTVLELRVDESEAARAAAWLTDECRLPVRHAPGTPLEITWQGSDPAELNRALVERGFRVSSLGLRRRRLEDVFVELTGEGAEVS